MGQQQIISNISTLDRGASPVVTADDVLKAARECRGGFTTYDIARALGVEEYPVRVAITWLVRRRAVERIGTEKRPLPARPKHGNRETYPATLYRVKDEAAPVDFSALNRAFGFA